jgi:micrococcal nuclease
VKHRITAAAAALLILTGCAGNGGIKPTIEPAPVTTNLDGADLGEPTDSPNITTTATHIEVLSVHDGDTFRVNWDGTSTPVRILGIDTPELANNNTGTPQCWAEHATATTTSLLSNPLGVTLIYDPKQGDRDRYGRLLRIVILPNGTDLASFLVRNGDARVYTDYPMSKTDQYLRDQQAAQQDNGGLGGWAVCGWTQ